MRGAPPACERDHGVPALEHEAGSSPSCACDRTIRAADEVQRGREPAPRTSTTGPRLPALKATRSRRGRSRVQRAAGAAAARPARCDFKGVPVHVGDEWRSARRHGEHSVLNVGNRKVSRRGAASASASGPASARPLMGRSLASGGRGPREPRVPLDSHNTRYRAFDEHADPSPSDSSVQASTSMKRSSPIWGALFLAFLLCAIPQASLAGQLRAPHNRAAPKIAGAAVQVRTLSARHGRWTNGPTVFRYAWQSCNRSGRGVRQSARRKARESTGSALATSATGCGCA